MSDTAIWTVLSCRWPADTAFWFGYSDPSYGQRLKRAFCSIEYPEKHIMPKSRILCDAPVFKLGQAILFLKSGQARGEATIGVSMTSRVEIRRSSGRLIAPVLA